MSLFVHTLKRKTKLMIFWSVLLNLSTAQVSTDNVGISESIYKAVSKDFPALLRINCGYP